MKVTPRFPGVIRSMRKRLGDKVKKDEVLATVESNQSLTTYELKAPIDGTVIDRDGTLGRVRLRAEAALHHRRPVDHVDRLRRLPPRLRARAHGRCRGDRRRGWRAAHRGPDRLRLAARRQRHADRSIARAVVANDGTPAARPVRRSAASLLSARAGRGRRQDRARSRRWRARRWCSCAKGDKFERARGRARASATPTGSRSRSACCRATSMPRRTASSSRPSSARRVPPMSTDVARRR